MKARTTTQELADIAAWVPLVALLRTTRSPGVGQGRRSQPFEQAPISVGPIALIQDIHGTLGSWVRLVMEESGTADTWPDDYLIAVCDWLGHHLGFLLSHPASSEFRDEVHHAWRRMQGAVGERPTRRPRCTSCGWSVDGYDEDNEDTDDQTAWRWCCCSGCGLTFTFDAALRELGRTKALTVPQYADEIGKDRTAVWRRVKKLNMEPIGKHGSSPLYAVEALATLYVDTGR